MSGGSVLVTRSYAVGSGAWFGPGEGFFFALFTLIPLIIVLLLWLLLARSTYLQGDDMERPSRVAQLYGYTVCLIAVVVFLVSTNSLLENAFVLSNPLQAPESGYGFPEPSVASFESYRATYDRERQMRSGPDAPAVRDSVPEAAMRARYEVLRADRISRVRFQAQRALATSTLSLILAIALFAIHWRWLRSRSDVGPTPGEPKGAFQ
jgi:hypothetical protein